MSVTLVVTNVSAGRADAAAERLTFDQPRIVIGRGTHADVRLPSRAVSETHAVVRMAAGELSLVDEASTNGTAVNGQLVARGRKKSLKPGDRIEVPGFAIVLEATPAPPDPADRTATVARKLLAAALAAAGGEAAPPELVVETGRKPGLRWKFPPAPAKLVAGRGEVCEVILDDPDCSRQHAEFARGVEGVTVRDLGSKNGVLVGERRVSEQRRLRDGDRVQVGRTVLAFFDPAEELLRAFEGGTDEPAQVSARPAAASDPGAPRSLPPPPPDGIAPAPDASAPGTNPGRASTPPGGAPAPVAEESAPAAPPADSSASAPAAPPLTPAEKPEPARANAVARHRHAADWVVIALAVVILLVSVAALVFLLRGTPAPGRLR